MDGEVIHSSNNNNYHLLGIIITIMMAGDHKLIKIVLNYKINFIIINFYVF
jgi:hypothetical protein